MKIEESCFFVFEFVVAQRGGVDEGPSVPELSPGKFFWRFSVAMSENFDRWLRQTHRKLAAVTEISGVPGDITGKAR